MIVVTPAARSDVDAAARLLASAFHQDPTMSAYFGDAPDIRERMERLFRVTFRTGLTGGAVDVAREAGDDEILGVAIWSAPGHLHSGVLRSLLDLPGYIRAFGMRGLGRARTMDELFLAARPAAPHWYLEVIGASTPGRGIGSVLLTSRLAALDAQPDHPPAYLEATTPQSAALYARHGFVPTGPVPGFDPDPAPLSMWRDGRPSA